MRVSGTARVVASPLHRTCAFRPRATGRDLASAPRDGRDPIRRGYPEGNGPENRFLFSQGVKQRQHCFDKEKERKTQAIAVAIVRSVSPGSACASRPTDGRNRRKPAPEKTHLEPARDATAAFASPIDHRHAIPLATARIRRRRTSRILPRRSWDAKDATFPCPRKHSPSSMKLRSAD